MRVEEVLNLLAPKASDKTKKRYMSQGAKEPLLGMTIKELKPVAKMLMADERCQQIALDLYETGNYDLMYLAGMIVDPKKLSKQDFDDWLSKAYFYMISDFIVAVCLSETDIAFEVADAWIKSDQDLVAGGGYATYSWMLASRKDEVFDKDHLRAIMLGTVDHLKRAGERTKYDIYYFLYNLGLSYIPLAEEALALADEIGPISVIEANGKTLLYHAGNEIRKQVDKGNLGFKRRYVRC